MRSIPATRPHDDVRRTASGRPAIYLHSTWRSASTYVWAKFRDCHEHHAYFEPLNEHLADADPEFVASFTPWPFANHPALAQPYLAEFLPLLAAGGGIEGFPAELTFGQYRLDSDARLPRLERYFERLERFATDRDRVPVFGCVRTDLRVGWFRAHRPGVHVALRRHPRQQFLSCLAQAAKGNPYFLQRGLVVLASNEEDPVLTAIRALAGLGGDTLRLAQAARNVPDVAALYMVAYALDRLALAETRHADLVLDMDAITRNAEAAQRAEAAIGDLTGTAISFADCRAERYERVLETTGAVFAAIEARVDALLSEHVSEIEPARTAA